MHKHIHLIISIRVPSLLGLMFIILSLCLAEHPAWVDTQYVFAEIIQFLPQC